MRIVRWYPPRPRDGPAMVDEPNDNATLPDLGRWGVQYPPGTPIDRYVILQPLGRGGTAAVYAAYDPELDRRVALKFLLPAATEGTDSNALQARLLLEARAMARLSHPNVVTLYQVGTAPEGRIYLAMELVEGGSMSDWLKAEKRGWREIVDVLCQAGEGLMAAHQADMIHRDFKIDNVLVRKDGRAQVTDFGIVWAARDRAPSEERETAPVTRKRRDPSTVKTPSYAPSLSFPRLTVTGSMLGTPGYMAPEQYAMDAPLDVRTDVFAFCATLYRALYGKRPFEGEHLDEVADATLHGRVRELPARTDVPRWIHKIILWGLSVEPKDRPASMEVVLAALRNDPARRRMRWIAAALAVVALFALVAGVRNAGQGRVRACHQMADRLGGTWDGPRKAAIGEAFHATGLVYADDTWARVEQRLDDYAATWSSSMYDACAATRIRGDQSEEMLDLRAQCLGERLDDLKALSDVFSGADAKAVGQALHLAIGLPPLEACSHLDRLSLATRLPRDPKVRDEIHALQAEIAEAREQIASGQDVKGMARLQAIADRVKAVGYGPVLVAWTMGSAASERGRDLAAATEGWKTAVAMAEEYHLDHEKGEIEVELGGIFEEGARYADSHLWFSMAGATLKRVGGEPKLELKRDMLEGCTYYDEGKHDDAARLFQRVVDRAAAGQIDDPFRIAISHSLLGTVIALDPARADEALSHENAALSIMRQAFGEQNTIAVLSMLMNMADTLELLGRNDEALDSDSKAIDVARAAIVRGEIVPTHIDLGLGLQSKGDLLIRMGRYDEAFDPLRESAEICRANGRVDTLPLTDADVALAYLRTGHMADAERSLAEARSAAESNEETGEDVKEMLLRTEAEILLEQGPGKVAKAVEAADPAVKIAETGIVEIYELATARMVLAKALVRAQKDLDRANRLAEQAREGFARLHDTRHATEAVDK